MAILRCAAGRKFCLRLYLLNLVFFCISLSFKAWFAVDLQGGMYAYYLVFMLIWHVCLMRFGLCVRGMECLWRALLFTGLMLLSEGFAALFATLFTARSIFPCNRSSGCRWRGGHRPRRWHYCSMVQ